jgi:hypothetical protein
MNKRPAVRTIHVAHGGVAIIVQVYGKARVIIHRTPGQPARLRKRNQTVRN